MDGGPAADAQICVGMIVGAKGVQGAVRVKPFTDDPKAVAAYGPVTDSRGRSHHLTITGRAKGVVIARIQGVADRDAAEALKGERLYVARTALPSLEEETYYHADLIGLTVVRTEGGEIGTVKAVHNFGSGDLLEIATASGREALVPFTRAAACRVDLAAGVIVIDPAAPGVDLSDLEGGEAGKAGEGERND